jgi:transketolase
MTLYPILADLGFFDTSELDRFTKKDSLLRLYADSSIPGIEATTGSLGHGFGLGCGHALSALRSNQSYMTYVIVSDGECYEGSVWEAAMFAANYELSNLIVIVDRNGQCILGETESCLKLGSLEEKWAAFGWNVESIDGHSYSQITAALNKLKTLDNKKPGVIISNSTKGKGIPFMESDRLWHNKIPTAEEFQMAKDCLETNPIRD